MPKTPSHPLSERRLASNRANAQERTARHSGERCALNEEPTGPRTPEGKSRSSQNAVKHGFRSSSFAVVRLEDLNEIANMKADAVFCYKPVNAQELFAVEQIALAQHRMLRAARLEAGLFTDALNEATDPADGNPFTPMSEQMVGNGEIEITRAQNRNYALAEGFRKLAKESNLWQLFLRYQSQAERMYRRALEDFERLKSLRNELPNEPNIGTEPEQKEELPTLNEIHPQARKSSEPNPAAPKSALRPSPAAVPASKPAPPPANPPHPDAIKPAA